MFRKNSGFKGIKISVKNKILTAFLVLISIWAASVLFSGTDGDVSAAVVYLRIYLAKFQAFAAAYPVAMPFLFLLVILICALTGFPPPGLAIVGGSALIGFSAAFFIALPSAALGALVPFFAARYFLLSRVEKWFPESYGKFQSGIKDDLGFYLFSLRLVPLVPFPLVNLFMGITVISPLRFFLITLFGRIPLTFLYCSAGQAISELHSLADIFSLKVTLTLLALALLPHIVKSMLAARIK